MEGERTTYGFTLSVLFQIALCICFVKCLTWLGTILQMGLRSNFRHSFIHSVAAYAPAWASPHVSEWK